MSAALTRTRFLLLAFVVAMTVVVSIVADLAPAAAEAPVLCKDREATIVGTPGPDVLDGTNGKDVIHGLGGNDVIRGLGGADIICGGAGDDVIRGYKGADRIYGGGGDDDLRGGKGHDRIYGKAGTDTASGGTGSDVCLAESEGNCELDKRWGHLPDDWLPLLEEYFGDIGETANARIILGCESTGEPFVLGPDTQWGNAMGLFQFIPPTWDQWNPETTGWAGESPFHPEANIATARRLYDAYVDWDGRWGWTPWSCKRLLDPPS
ncbi:MAG: hypothetical protein GY720_02135 [bacterium]|nr:hypothetical protein [bacterium]